MPCVYIKTCFLKDILAAMTELPSHSWLVTDLECYDDCGWDGCEKWAERELLLTDEALRRDVDLRDMQIIWGVFSAIPVEYSQEDIFKHPRPRSEDPRYMSSRIVPQHPLAVLELYVDDGCFTLVSSHDAALLAPLYKLPHETRDKEADNSVMNAQLCRIQDILRGEVPNVPPETANEVQWKVWHALLKNSRRAVEEEALRSAVMKEYSMQQAAGRNRSATFWDPYTQSQPSRS